MLQPAERRQPRAPIIKSDNPPPMIKSVGLTEPAGARVEPAADAISSGREPMVRVKVIDEEVVATATSLSPVSSVAWA